MTADFLILLLSAAFAAYGAHTAIRLREPGRWAAASGATVLFLAVGMTTVMLAILTGDGRIVPGYQIHPSLKAMWGHSMTGLLGWPVPTWILFVLIAHGLVMFPTPSRPRVFAPLPATLFFGIALLVLAARTGRPGTEHARTLGPEEQNAYLTVWPTGPESVRIIIASGREDAAFVKVHYVHEAKSRPPQEPRPPRMAWTRDGYAIVLQVFRWRLVAIDLDNGAVIGGLPDGAGDWPSKNPERMPNEARQQQSEWRRDVDEFIASRGGLLRGT
ncbi:MAG: hypothetical protein ACYTGN_16780 [Planctomycetota bacterium]|jgi:hypothetical protein